MIYVEVTAREKGYDVVYHVNGSPLPVDKNGVWIVGRSAERFDSLVGLIADDIKGKKACVVEVKGFAKSERERVHDYIEKMACR